MKREHNIPDVDLAGRLKDIEQFTGTLVRRHSEHDAIPINEPPVARVPVPRRSRVFLRSGRGHGVFADLTLTAPIPSTALD
jgi:hypothetical protein